MPQREFALIADLESRALEFRRTTAKRGSLGVCSKALAALTMRDRRAVLEALTALKACRPKKAA